MAWPDTACDHCHCVTPPGGARRVASRIRASRPSTRRTHSTSWTSTQLSFDTLTRDHRDVALNRCVGFQFRHFVIVQLLTNATGAAVRRAKSSITSVLAWRGRVICAHFCEGRGGAFLYN
jgi:hypothetical protein